MEAPIRHGRKRSEGIPLWAWVIGVLIGATVSIFIIGGVL